MIRDYLIKKSIDVKFGIELEFFGTCNALLVIGLSLIKIHITNVPTHMFEYFISIRVDLHFLCSLWQQNSDDIRGQSSSHTKNETQIIDTQHNNTHNYLQKP